MHRRGTIFVINKPNLGATNCLVDDENILRLLNKVSALKPTTLSLSTLSITNPATPRN